MLKKIAKNIPVLYWFYHQIKKYINLIDFKKEFISYRKLAEVKGERFPMEWRNRRAILNEKTNITNFDRHYVYHTAWAARILAQIQPEFHVDISSSLYFCSIVSAFIPTNFYDYRLPNLDLDNLSVESADIFALPFATASVWSLSCMHVVEHIGLGRYGEALDPDGDLKAITELKRVLAVGGSLLLVVPIGEPKVIFNAHRIYSYNQIINYFLDLNLKEFALIPDKLADGGLIRHANPELADTQTYGCGCFWFKKTYQ
ncbi:DUF268 domain-containing protein [Coleofasciculus chthonoplastes]|uniref:DUF268 domain-containing protein n=1 Tax=Coleofasciculus chthonoplastes TaxID=64178 RepID=UPI0032F9E8BF